MPAFDFRTILDYEMSHRPADIPAAAQAASEWARQVMSGEMAQQGVDRYRSLVGSALNNPDAASELMSELMPGGMALTAARAAKEVPGFRKLFRYMTDEEKALYENPQYAKSAQSAVDYARRMTSPQELATVARSGGAKQGWYRDSTSAIRQIFANPERPDDPDRFIGLLASLSPQTSVETNMKNALNTWVNWVQEGRPKDVADIKRILSYSTEGADDVEKLDKMKAWWMNAARALRSDNPAAQVYSGPKVNSFNRNLQGDLNEVTNDTWMGYAMGVPQSVFGGSRIVGADDIGAIGGKGPGYIAANAITRRAADMADMAPANVQENVWSWAKTLKELSEKPGAVVKNAREHGLEIPDSVLHLTEPGGALSTEQILRSGLLSDDLIGVTPAFGPMMQMDPYLDILQSGGYPVVSTILGDISDNILSPISRVGITPQQLSTTPEGRNLLRMANRVGRAKK